jgi:hypothetical protein
MPLRLPMDEGPLDPLSVAPFPWPEPDITSLDPALVVTRNGVTHPSVAWLMSFPNRYVSKMDPLSTESLQFAWIACLLSAVVIAGHRSRST